MALASCSNIGNNLIFSPECNYFEVEIIEKGASHLTISIGIVSRLFSMDNLPGRINDSFAFCPGDGLLFRSREVGSPFGPRAEPGDKVGCGIKFLSSSSLASRNPLAASFQLFFTHNGKGKIHQTYVQDVLYTHYDL